MCAANESRKMDYRTLVDSFMPPEPQIPANRLIHLERLIEEEDLQERYEKAYDMLKE